MMSGKRDSNSRPQPWQGCALPTELFPHIPAWCIGVENFVFATPQRYSLSTFSQVLFCCFSAENSSLSRLRVQRYDLFSNQQSFSGFFSQKPKKNVLSPRAAHVICHIFQSWHFIATALGFTAFPCCWEAGICICLA